MKTKRITPEKNMIKAKKLTHDKRPVYFDAWDYIDFVHNAMRDHPDKNRFGLWERERSSFTLTESPEEAEDFALRGWDVGIEKMAQETDLNVVGNAQATFAVAGGFPSVPRYLAGVPDSMVTFTEERSYNLPRVTLYLPNWFPVAIKAERALDYAIELTNLINEMQKTHFVKIVSINYSTHPDFAHFIAINLKEYNDPIVLNTLAFAFHPGFNRRLVFQYYEQVEGTKSHCGMSIGEKDSLKAVKNYDAEFGDGEKAFMAPSLYNGSLDTWPYKEKPLIDKLIEV